MRKYILSLYLLVSIISCKNSNSIIAEYSYLPENKAQSVVLDNSKIFSKSQIDSLSTKIINFEKTSTNEIAILTVDSILPYTDISKYANAIGNFWGVGKKEKDNGLVIVLLPKKRKVWVALGDGTQKTITDSICKTIIDDAMVPYFKNKDYYNGLDKALDSIIKKWY